MSVQRWTISTSVHSDREDDGNWVTYADHVAALAEAEQRGMMNSHRGRTMYAAGRAEALREAREAVAAFLYSVDDDVESILAAIDALAARQAPEASDED
jgi:hypothetical protein